MYNPLSALKYTKYLEYVKDIYPYLRYLKEQRFSHYVHDLRIQMLQALQSGSFSHRIDQFFPDTQQKVEQLHALDDTFNQLDGTVTEAQRIQLIEKLEEQTLPYSGLDAEPAQVSQVKKIINALYHAELALLGMEKLALEGIASLSTASDFNILYHQVSTHLYRAAHLITHVDFDIQALFQDEINFLIPYIMQFDSMAKTFAGTSQAYVLGYNAKPLEEGVEIIPSNVYMKVDGGELVYAVRDAEQNIIHGRMLLSMIDFDYTFPVSFSQLQQSFPKIISILAEQGHVILHPYSKVDFATKAGSLTGVAVNQLKPKQGAADYTFLAQLTGALPRHLSEWTERIKEYADEYNSEYPTIDPEKLEELKDNALHVLHALEDAEGGTWTLSVRSINYIRIIRHSITLSMSIIEQSMTLNESSQDTLCANVGKLKELLSSELVGCADKIEETLMLKPGFLSDHIKGHVEAFYSLVVSIAGNYVDFKTRQPDLLTLDDSVSLSVRTEKMFKRRGKLNQETLRLSQVKESARLFFELLNRKDVRASRLVNLPADIKGELKKYYHAIQPYVVRLKILNDEAVVKALNSEPGRFELMDIARLFVYLDGSAKDEVNKAIDKDIATNRLLTELNVDLSKSLTSSRNSIDLYPCQIDQFFYRLDEQAILEPSDISQLEFKTSSGNKLVKNPEKLTAEQARTLFGFYKAQQNKFEGAKRAFDEFVQYLTDIKSAPQPFQISEDNLSRLRRLYCMFQPYLINMASVGENRKQLDEDWVQLLKKTEPLAVSGALIQNFLALKSDFSRSSSYRIRVLENKKRDYEHLSHNLYSIEQNKKLLRPVEQHLREQYVIKHQRYSKTLRAVRASLKEYTQFFNTSVKEALVEAEEGVPFPDLELEFGRYSNSSQVLVLKRLRNAVYYLEQAFENLEQLNDSGLEVTYSTYLILASYQLYNFNNVFNQLRADPYISYVSHELMQKWEQVYTETMSFIQPYLPPLEENTQEPDVDSVDEVEENVQINSVVLRSLNAMMVLPEHLKVLYGGEELTEEQVQKCHRTAREISTTIQRIIDNSNSYFKLCLELPAMYRLFNELKKKLELATSSLHGGVLDNLEEIRNKLLPNILIEFDLWEDKFALKPGTITEPAREILEAYFVGMLEALELPSGRHLDIIRSVTPVEARSVAAAERKIDVIKNLAEIYSNLKIVTELQNKVETYRRVQQSRTRNAQTATALREGLKRYVNSELMPLIKGIYQQAMDYDMDATKNIKSMDDFLDAKRQLDVIKLKQVLGECSEYYQRLGSSQDLNKKTIDEKVEFLNQLQMSKPAQDREYTLEYTKKLFDQQANLLSSKEFGLVHCEVEYRQALFAYLNGFREEIVNHAKECEDIRKDVIDSLSEKIQQFEKEHYEDYAQLSAIKASIDQFRIYLRDADVARLSNSFFKGTSFESEHTLREKKKLILELKDIANNQRDEKAFSAEEMRSVKDRIQRIREKVSVPTFRTTMLRYHTYEKAWYHQLVNLLATLLRWVGWKPAYEANYNKIKDAVDKKPKLERAAQQYGLFYKAAVEATSDRKTELQEPSNSRMNPQGN